MTQDDEGVLERRWDAKTRALAACLEVLLRIDLEKRINGAAHPLFRPAGSLSPRPSHE